MNRVTSSVLNSVAATAGDISVSDGSLSITGCPTMQYSLIKSAGQGLVLSLLATPQVYTVTPTAANNTTYTLQITQYVASAGHIITRVLSYTSLASGSTATTICNFLRLQLAAYTDIEITGSGTATLILTASSDSPIFTVTNTSAATMTIASSMLTASIQSNTTGTPSVITTTAAHGMVVGQTVTLTSLNQTKLVDGTYRIATVPNVDEMTLTDNNGVPLTGTATTTGTLTLVAQVSRGSYADLVAAGVSGATSGNTYAQIPFTFADGSGQDSNLNQVTYPLNIHTLYVYEGDADFANFRTRMVEVLNAFPSGGSTFPDPELVAVRH